MEEQKAGGSGSYRSEQHQHADIEQAPAQDPGPKPFNNLVSKARHITAQVGDSGELRTHPGSQLQPKAVRITQVAPKATQS